MNTQATSDTIVHQNPSLGTPPVASVSIPTFDQLLQTSAAELSHWDIGLRNLLCATGLPGAEDMQIREYMRRLQSLTEYVRKKTQRLLPLFRENPGQFNLPKPVTENFFRVIVLVHTLKTDAGLRYNPGRIDPMSLDKPFNAKDMLINGLLSDERIGTCNTIPVVITAVGRRLGYPLYLCCTHNHVWTRWEGAGERFNIEASGPNDFSDFDDEHFRAKLEPLLKAGIDTSYYLKNLAPADELALFLFSRAWVLEDHQRFEESLPAWVKCCFLAPDEPIYPRRAYAAALEVLHVRKFGKPSRRGPDHKPLTEIPVGQDIQELLSPNEVGIYLSIQGHIHEAMGDVDKAASFYGAACQKYPENIDYRQDCERYLKRIAHDAKTSPTSDAIAISLGMEREMVAAYEQRGLRFEKAGDWAGAQCAFVCGSVFPKIGHSCGEHLKRVIRKEIDAGMEPRPGHRGADPRFALPRESQGSIWMFRDLALRSLGRMDEALAACKEACRLWPTQPHWTQELRRFSQEFAKMKAQEKERAQAQSSSKAAKDRHVPKIFQNVGFIGGSAPIHANVTWFSGSLFPPIEIIKQKE